ncbi:MAG TPA: Gfo/Idh/MocA family oxidoreductase [Vicinamibacterales bacterium]
MKPRVGFLGLGWIGRHRLRSLVASEAVEVAGLADANPAAIEEARALAPAAPVVATLEELLDLQPDGLVIATPSAQHAREAIAVLNRGIAVFVQKPLARTGAEAGQVVAAARAADRLLGVDLSYRHTRAIAAVRELLQAGTLGSVYAADLVFHNAYGPDKPWYYDRATSGGGCVMDLGIHLVDLAVWLLGGTALVASCHLFAGGRPWTAERRDVEDFAVAQLELSSGAVARLACSWRAPAGCHAVIGLELTGTRGGARFRNVQGSFYDFVAEHLDGTSTRVLASPPDDWGGRAAIAWTHQLARGGRYDPACESQITLARAIDDLYRAGAERTSMMTSRA